MLVIFCAGRGEGKECLKGRGGKGFREANGYAGLDAEYPKVGYPMQVWGYCQ